MIAEATTCRYRVTWTPPRDYDYAADEGGWITDSFISGVHGWVSWNLRTGEVVVRPYEDTARRGRRPPSSPACPSIG